MPLRFVIGYCTLPKVRVILYVDPDSGKLPELKGVVVLVVFVPLVLVAVGCDTVDDVAVTNLAI